MKILLTNPPSEINNEIYKRAGVRWPSPGYRYTHPRDPRRYVPFPFFLAYTASILRNESNTVRAIDAVALQMNEKTYYKKVKERMPDIIIQETSSPTIELDLKTAKKMKETTGAKIVFVGAHASTYPKEILKNRQVDYVAIGEYEYTIKELIQKLKKKQDTSKIKGLALKKQNKIIINERRDLIYPLDTLPYPARDIFPIDDAPDLELYQDGMGKISPEVKIMSSRGCPFRCNYCLWTQIIYPGKYRMHSAKRVTDEIEYVIKNHGAKSIYFDDDTFTANPKHVMEICSEIKKRNIKIQWAAMCDAIIITEEMIKSMSEAGCKTAMFGLESADKDVLRRIGKPLDPKKIKRVIEWCHKYDIMTHVTNCYGITGDTLETMKKTLEFTCKLGADSCQFSFAIPYPGTRFYEEAKDKGWLKKHDWKDIGNTAIISYPELSAEEIKNWCVHASEYYNKTKRRNRGWLIRAAKRTYKKEGALGLLKSTRNYIKMIINGKY